MFRGLKHEKTMKVSVFLGGGVSFLKASFFFCQTGAAEQSVGQI